MSINSQIIGAVSGFAPCFPWEDYEGSEDAKLSRYFVFNYDVVPYTFGNDDAPFERYLIQLHYFCPRGENTVRLRRQIKRSIALTEDFTIPSETNASDQDGQHYVFEFEALGLTWGENADGD